MESLSEEESIQYFLQPPERWPYYDGYKALNPKKREIRVLHIELQSDNTEIHGRLEHVSLDNKPMFEAISYYWGPPAQQKSILLGGKTVSIRATLHSFMTILCRKGLRTPLWLDALCINQRDDLERSQQVAMMSDIYRSAAGIRSWIGNGDADTDYALGFLQHRHEATLTESPHFGATQDRARESLLVVARRPYWSRLWVLQELALARSVTVHCGLFVVSWTDLISAVKEALRPTPTDFKPFLQVSLDNIPSPNTTQEQVLQPLIALDNLRNTLRETSPQYFNLLDRVFAFHDYGCVDKRDKMFGLLSLAAPESHPLVDYTATLVDVFTNMLCQSLGLLSKQYALFNENDSATSGPVAVDRDSVTTHGNPESRSFAFGFQSRITLKILYLLRVFNIKKDILGKSLQVSFNDRYKIFHSKKVGQVTTRVSISLARSRYWDPESWLFAPCAEKDTPEPGDEIVSVTCHNREIRIPKIIVRRDTSGRYRILGATWRFASLRVDDQFPLLADSIAKGHVEIVPEDTKEPDELRFRCSRAFALAVFMNYMLDMSAQRPHLDVFLRALSWPIATDHVTTRDREKPYRLLKAAPSFRFSFEEARIATKHNGDGADHGDWTALTDCLERGLEQRRQSMRYSAVEEAESS